MREQHQHKNSPTGGRSVRTRRSVRPNSAVTPGIEPAADDRSDADPRDDPPAGATLAGRGPRRSASKTCNDCGQCARLEPVGPTGEPWLLTVEQAASVLQIGRTLAYELVRRYEESGGAVGIPVVRIGRILRVPPDELVERIRSSRINGEVGADDELAVRRRPVGHDPAVGNRAADGVSSRRRRGGGPGPDQPPLFPAV